MFSVKPVILLLFLCLLCHHGLGYEMRQCMSSRNGTDTFPTDTYYVAALARWPLDPYTTIRTCVEINILEMGGNSEMIIKKNASNPLIASLYEFLQCSRTHKDYAVVACFFFYVKPSWFLYIECGGDEELVILGSKDKGNIGTNGTRTFLEEWLEELQLIDGPKASDFTFTECPGKAVNLTAAILGSVIILGVFFVLFHLIKKLLFSRII